MAKKKNIDEPIEDIDFNSISVAVFEDENKKDDFSNIPDEEKEKLKDNTVVTEDAVNTFLSEVEDLYS